MHGFPVATVVMSHSRQSDQIHFFLSEFTWQTCRKRQRRHLPALLASAHFLSGLIVRRADDICPGLLCKLQPIGLEYAFFFLSLCQTREWWMLPHPSHSLIKYVSAWMSQLTAPWWKCLWGRGVKMKKIHFTSTNKHVNTPYLSSQASI